MASFENQKKLRVTITLGKNTFGDSDRIVIENYRMTTTISDAGGLHYGSLNANIYGMKQSDMDAITTYQYEWMSFKPNVITVEAIDGDMTSMVFLGNIVTAWAEYGGMPDVCLNIQAQTAATDRMRAVPPKSFKGTVDVANAMAQIAASMGYTFVNNGVSATLENVYLDNTGIDQAKQLADHAKITCIISSTEKSIKISPIGKPFDAPIPLISRETGMIGYPSYDGVTVVCRTIYNPSIAINQLVRLETDVKRANGDWLVSSVDYALDSDMPDGQWFCVFRGINPKVFGYGRQ